MPQKRLQGGTLRHADYDEAEKTLAIEFADGTTRTFSAVPAEVWRRLIAAPNPAAFYEDRIAEEYPVKSGRSTGKADPRSRLDDLFGKKD